MRWPQADEYQAAVQNPGFNFTDPDLKASKVAINKLGLPRVASGNFASVYEMQKGAQRWAVRCFLHPPKPDQQLRYDLLSRHLANLSLPSLVEFEYQPQGILVGGTRYPIVKMEWVEGELLTTYLEKRRQEPRKIQALASQWRGLVNSLQGNKLAHGDLQHGNILVTAQDQIKLVDYDNLFVPALRGRPSHELGHRNFQHPRRSPSDFDEKLDNFAALVIYLILRALTVEPGLWQVFKPNDNLILSAKDYAAPAGSAAFRRLQQSSDPVVQRLAATLIRCCLTTMGQIPDFETVVAAALAGTAPPVPSTSPAPSAVPALTPPTIKPAVTSSPSTPAKSLATNPSLSLPPIRLIAPAVSLHGNFMSPDLVKQGIEKRLGRGTIFSAHAVTDDHVVIITRGGAGLLDLKTRSVLWEIIAPVQVGALSPAGDFLALSSSESVSIWDLRLGQERYRIPVIKVASITWSPDGRLLGLGDAEGNIRFWDVAGNKEAKHWQHDAAYRSSVSVVFSSDGRLLASWGGGTAAKICLWETSTGRLLRQWGEWSQQVFFSADGKFLIHDRTNKQEIAIRELSRGQELYTLPLNYYRIALSSNGLLAGRGQTNTKLEIWQISTGLKVHCDFALAPPSTYPLGFTPNGRTLITNRLENPANLQLWSIPDGKEIGQQNNYTLALSTESVASFDGRTLVSGGISFAGTPAVMYWDTATGGLIRALPIHGTPINASRWYINCVRFSPDGRTLAVKYIYDDIGLWEAATGKDLGLLYANASCNAHTSGSETIAFSPDGKRLAAGSHDHSIRIWDTTTRNVLQHLKGHTKEVTCVAFSPDGWLLASGGNDGILGLWEVDSGQPLRLIEAQIGPIGDIAFSPDGQKLAAIGNLAKIWNVPNSARRLGALTEYRVLKAAGKSIAFSRDGRRIATGLSSNGVILWDVASGNEVRSTRCYYPVNDLAFSPDDHKIAFATSQGSVWIWKVG